MANYFTFSLGIPQIKSLTVKEHNVNITWLPAFDGECHVLWYMVYYRDVISGVNKGQWNAVNMSQHEAAAYHSLQLQCYKEYEITVTAWSENGETPLNQSKLVKVKTGGGNYNQNREQDV